MGPEGGFIIYLRNQIQHWRQKVFVPGGEGSDLRFVQGPGLGGRGVLKREKKSVPKHSSPKKTVCSSYVQPWRMAVGGWRLAVGGDWRLAVGHWWVVAVGGGWRRLVVGDWWLVAVGNGWRLVIGRRWQLAAVGGWQLVAVGGWQLVVPWGGP